VIGCFVAGLVASKIGQKDYQKTIPLEAYHYNYWKQRDLRERAAWVTDFCFRRAMDKPEWL